MQRVATAWLIYTLGNSEAWLGFDAAMAAIPTFLVLPFSGVLADCFDRRGVLILANILNAILAIALAAIWWSGSLAVWHLLIGSLLSAMVAALASPASQSLVPTAAGEDHIPNAVALNSFQYNVARAVGPAIGGLALVSVGAGWCFILNALTYLGLIFALLAVPSLAKPLGRKASALESAKEGLDFLRHNTNVRLSIALVLILAFGGAPMVTLLPVIAKGVLNEGAAGYSMLLSGFGVGAALAGALLTFLRPSRLPKWIIGAAIICAICHVAIVFTSTLAIAVSIALIAGCAFVGAMIELGTQLIFETPDELRGRISAVQQLSFRTAQPLGGLIGALIARYSGIQVAFIGFGLLLVLGVLTVLLFCKHPKLR